MADISFETELLKLLPPLYTERDHSGELATFLKLPGKELDRLKALADRFPELLDVDRCDPKFLPYLAAIVGWPYDPTSEPAFQRQAIREAVEFYRRKSTIPAITRSLREAGWEGWIEETYRRTFRLNRRARLNQRKLAGTVFSYGVYRVYSSAPIANIREVLAVHHPAGTRAFFLTQLMSVSDIGFLLEAYILQFIRWLAPVRLWDVFILNKSRLNGPDPLTVGNPFRTAVTVTRTNKLRQGFDWSVVCFRTWRVPTPGFRLNQSRLNGARLPNVRLSELVSSRCCPISVDDPPPARRAPLRLNQDQLNQASLGGGLLETCQVFHLQRDLFSFTEMEPGESLGGHQGSNDGE